MSEMGPFIGGKWLVTDKTFHTINPYSGETIAEIYQADDAMVEQAIRAAAQAFHRWSNLPMEDRIQWFKKLKSLLLDRAEEIARMIAIDQGKPLTEAMLVEVIPAIDALDFYIRKAPRYLSPTGVRHWQVLFRGKKARYQFDPLGVVGVISPWNYPFIIPFLDITAALIAGNTVVFKPSSLTPMVGIEVARLFADAGFPDGTVNLLTGPGGLGAAIVKHDDVRVIMFTGSVETGKVIYSMASDGVKKLVLELGGKDPAVVMPDADLELAVNGILWGAFMNAGQTCASVERVYVHESIYDRFVQMAVERTRQLRTGDPLDPETEIGPLNNSAQFRLVSLHIQDAVARGANLLVGGESEGLLMKPAVLTGVNHTMRIMRDETFGPTMPIMRFKELEEAIKLANDTRYGLTASIWTRDRKAAELFINEVRAGTVTVNDHVFSFGEPEGAWGGTNFSGLGRTHGRYGLLELVNIKFVSEDFSSGTTRLWWYPYDEELRAISSLAVNAMFGEKHAVRIKNTLKLMKHLLRLIRTVGLKTLMTNIGKFL